MYEFDKQHITDEYENLREELENHLSELKSIIESRECPLEGNAFYTHGTLNLHPDLYTKQLNLFWCGKQVTTKMCEIGFNGGHSALLFLFGREIQPADFTIFDIGNHPYIIPCLDYMKVKFRHITFDYIRGDSTESMPPWIHTHQDLIGTYSLVHVDGGHSEHCISNDIKHADILLAMNGILIVDDTNDSCINSYVDKFILSGNYIEVNVLKSFGYEHRVLRKIK